MDDNIETNVSTFAAEMREIAFILRNIDRRSLYVISDGIEYVVLTYCRAIIDELGRGTSTRDGLAIALAIAEALVSSRASTICSCKSVSDTLRRLLSGSRPTSKISQPSWGSAQAYKTFIWQLRYLNTASSTTFSDLYVQLENDKIMTMLYRIAPGAVREVHYGLTLARVVPLPQGVVDHATRVAQQLEAHMLKRKKASGTVLREKRRKLILNLREHLVQAQTGVLEGEVLTAWLKELQKEFVNRMTALEVEVVSAGQESDDEDEVMGEAGVLDEEEERPGTHTSHPSVMTIDSSTSAESASTIRAMSEFSTVRAVSDNERY
jgi:DNA mismatch repair protein MSH4